MAARTNTKAPAPQPGPGQQQLHIGDEYADLIGLAMRPVVSAFTAGRKAQKGDVVAGTVVAEEWITTEFGPAVRSTLQTNPDPSSPLVSFVWLGTVLSQAHRRRGIGTGSRVAVVCHGEEATDKYGKGQTYTNWGVQVDNSGRTDMVSGVAPLGPENDLAADPGEDSF